MRLAALLLMTAASAAAQNPLTIEPSRLLYPAESRATFVNSTMQDIRIDSLDINLGAQFA